MFTTVLPSIPPPPASLLPPSQSFSQSPSHAPNHSHSHHSSEGHAHNAHAHHHLHHHHHHHAAYGTRRTKPGGARAMTTLQLLTLEERAVAQRKLAIAMYGYSWLKPAGCAKTMLGRREEEMEREEVERQMAEVERQERDAMAAEEDERARERERQRMVEEMGGVLGGEGEEQRDLDEDVPDASESEDNGELDEEVEEGLLERNERHEERDLDDEIPDADGEDAIDLDDEIPDADEGDSNDDDDDDGDEDNERHATQDQVWTYDTTRDPDSDSSHEHDRQPGRPSAGQQGRPGLQSRDNVGRRSRQQPPLHSGRYAAGGFVGLEDAAETHAMINAMLDEDELGALEGGGELRRDGRHDLVGVEMDTDMSTQQDRDLDDDVPEADADEGEWQHTDTELDDSEMDISMLPSQNIPVSRVSLSSSGHRRARASDRSSGIGPGTTHEEMNVRRTSGNVRPMAPPPPGPHASSSLPQQGPHDTQHGQQRQRAMRQAHVTPHQATAYHTPVMMDSGDSISDLISSDVSSANLASVENSANPEPASSDHGRSWLNPAGARRNLFGRTAGNVVSAVAAPSARGQRLARGQGERQSSSPFGISGTETSGESMQAQMLANLTPAQRAAMQNNTAAVRQNERGQVHPSVQGLGATVEVPPAAVSSGGLFTPPMMQSQSASQATTTVQGIIGTDEPPRSRTRSGRLLGVGGLGGIGRRRRG